MTETKPWEEEWEQDGQYVRLRGVATILKVRDFGDGGDLPRARLASKAPKMARALLSDMVLWEDGLWHDEFRCPALAGGQCAEWCQTKREVLREAGVLE